MKKTLRVLAWIPTGVAYLVISPFALMGAVVVVPVITMVAIMRFAHGGRWDWSLEQGGK